MRAIYRVFGRGKRYFITQNSKFLKEIQSTGKEPLMNMKSSTVHRNTATHS